MNFQWNSMDFNGIQPDLSLFWAPVAFLRMLSGITQTSPMSVDRGSGALPNPRRKRLFAMLTAVLPPLLLLIFPLGGELAEKASGPLKEVLWLWPRCQAVYSTGASALVVALVLLQAERASCQAERTQEPRPDFRLEKWPIERQGSLCLSHGFKSVCSKPLVLSSREASCKRAASLCEAFANRAEQQGALLPFNSAVAIALAGVITFLTELNPVTAAALTIFQAMSWLVASRKGVATKFESLASLQAEIPPATDDIHILHIQM